jgi:hypothetical protein
VTVRLYAFTCREVIMIAECAADMVNAAFSRTARAA